MSFLEESIDEEFEAISIEPEALQEPAADRQQKQKPRRAALPGHLPRWEIRHEPEQTQCSCGCALERVGEDVSEKLDYTSPNCLARRSNPVHDRVECAPIKFWGLEGDN